MRYIVILAVLILFTACAPPELTAENASDGFGYQEDVPARPDIPRTSDAGDGLDDLPWGEDIVPPQRGTPKDIFVVGPREHPGIRLELPFRELLGEHFPILTAEEYPLLGHPRLGLDLGHELTFGYEERIIFDHDKNTTGRIIFIEHPDTEQIGDFLFFEEDLPVFTYELLLHQGNFTAFEGRDIQLLGMTYIIAEATNNSVVLYGKDYANNLLFEEGRSLLVNGSRVSRAEAFVKPDRLGFTLRADDPHEGGILLGQGETLADVIGWRALGSWRWDIGYVGVPSNEIVLLELDRGTQGYTLRTILADGRPLDLRIVEADAGSLILGELDRPLHVERCPAHSYCIAPEQAILLQSPDGRTFPVMYEGTSNESRTINIEHDGTKYLYDFFGLPGRDAFSEILLEGARFTARIGPLDNRSGEANISITRGLPARIPRIILSGGFILEIGDVEEDSLSLELVVPRQFTHDGREERTVINMTFDGSWHAGIAGNLSLVIDDDDRDAFAATPYGVMIRIDDFDQGRGSDVSVQIPLLETRGRILLKG